MKKTNRTNKINLLKVVPDQKGHADFFALDLMRKGVANQSQFPDFNQVTKFYNYFNSNNKKIKTFICQYDVSLIECHVSKDFERHADEIRDLDIPFILSISYESLDVLREMISNTIWQQASLIVTSHYQIYEILSQGVFLNYDHFVYVQPGIETTKFQRDLLQTRDVLSYLKSLSHVSSKRYIAFGNQICTDEDVGFLKNALKSFRAHLQEYTLLIPVSRTLSDQSRHQLDRLREQNPLCFVELIAEKDISLFLAISDAVIVFNHQHRLIDLFIMMIAQSLETLVLECVSANYVSYVNNQKTGIQLVYEANENSSFDPLFKKIKESLLTDTSKIVDLAKQFVQENHDVSLYGEQMIHMYQKVLNEFKPKLSKKNNVPSPEKGSVLPQTKKPVNEKSEKQTFSDNKQDEQNILDHTELLCFSELAPENSEAKESKKEQASIENAKTEKEVVVPTEIQIDQKVSKKDEPPQNLTATADDISHVKKETAKSFEDETVSVSVHNQKNELHDALHLSQSQEIRDLPNDRDDCDSDYNDLDQKEGNLTSNQKKAFGDHGDVKLSRQDFSKLLLTDFVDSKESKEKIHEEKSDVETLHDSDSDFKGMPKELGPARLESESKKDSSLKIVSIAEEKTALILSDEDISNQDFLRNENESAQKSTGQKNQEVLNVPSFQNHKESSGENKRQTEEQFQPSSLDNVHSKNSKSKNQASLTREASHEISRETPLESPQKKILVFAHGNLSALIKTCGAFEAIRNQFPNDYVCVYTFSQFVSFLKFVDYFDAVLPDEEERGYWSSFQFMKTIKSQGFDYVIDLQGSAQTRRYGSIMNLLGGVDHDETHKNIRWIGHVEKSPYYQPEIMRKALHPYERYYDLLNRAHFHLPAQGILQPNLSHIQLGIRQDIPRPYFLLIPGGEASQKIKRWPALFYAEIANKLMRSGVHVVLIGAQEENAVFEVIKRKCPDVTDLVGQTELYEVLSLARESVGVLGNDSGPMFLAHASGQNVIIPWSSFSNDELNAPKGDNVTLIREAFLTNLSPHRVWHEVKKLLPSEKFPK